MCDKRRACLSVVNLLVAAALVQHVASVGGAAATAAATPVTSDREHVSATARLSNAPLAALTLVKRDINALDSLNSDMASDYDDDNDGDEDDNGRGRDHGNNNVNVNDNIVAINHNSYNNNNMDEVAASKDNNNNNNKNNNNGIRDVDFVAYANDFNMPAEASIPEDILDQRHIDDDDNLSAADVTSSNAEFAAQYGDSDAADIILESRRYSTKNFTYDTSDVDTNNNNNNNKHNNKEYNKKYNDNNNNKVNMLEVERTQDKDEEAEEEEEKEAAATEMQGGSENNAEDTLLLQPDESGNVASKKFKSLYDQQKRSTLQQQQQQQLKQQDKILVSGEKVLYDYDNNNKNNNNNDNDDDNIEVDIDDVDVDDNEDDKDEVGTKQMKTIEILNEGKFNKVVKPSNKKQVENKLKQQQQQRYDKHDNKYNHDDDDGLGGNFDFDIDVDDNESKNKHFENNKNENKNVENKKDIGKVEKKEREIEIDDEDTKLNDDDFAIGDIIDDDFRNEDESDDFAAYRNSNKDESLDNVDAPLTTTTTLATMTTRPTSVANFIPRKIKRHDTVAAHTNHHADGNRKPRNFIDVPHWYQRYGKPKSNVPATLDELTDESHSSQSKEVESSVHEAALNPHTGKNYFGILKNTSNSAEDMQQHTSVDNNRRQQQQQLADEDIGNGEHSLRRSHNNKAHEINQEDKILHDIATEPERQPSRSAGEMRATLESAFERHKATRRNNKHYGHRNVKKKYRDYLLRYAMTTMSTPPPTATTTTLTIIPSETIRNSDDKRIRNRYEVNTDISDTQKNAINATTTTTNTTATDVTNQIDSRSNNNTSWLTERKRKYYEKLETEKLQRLPPSPIFALGNRKRDGNNNNNNNNSNNNPDNVEHSSKPFYEGQINYYIETDDDDDDNDNTNNNHKSQQQQQQQRKRKQTEQKQQQQNNLYGRVNPVLRNGIKTSHPEQQQQHQHHHHHHNHNQQHYHHKHKHLQHHPYQHRQHHHNQHHHQHNHYRSPHQSSSNYQQHHQPHHHAHRTYQRKLFPSTSTPTPTNSYSNINGIGIGIGTASPSKSPTFIYHRPSHEGAMQELGHQITELKELERYYAKWPHLARVQLQVYDEHYREAHPELYPDYAHDNDDDDDADVDVDDDDMEDYESAAELEEAQSGHDEYANLPPYIKKFNRRNKQLLNLLEGTIAPPTRPPLPGPAAVRTWSRSLLQPGPHESSSSGGSADGRGGALGIAGVRIDDDYLKAKRRRYHIFNSNNNNNHNHNNKSGIASGNTNGNKFRYIDLFAAQRNANVTSSGIQNATSAETQNTNYLPDEDISISLEDDNIEAAVAAAATDEERNSKEMKTKSHAGSAQMTWQIEKLAKSPMTVTPSTTPDASSSTNAPRAAIFRLPSYPAFAGTYIGKPRNRNAQFAPSVTGGGRTAASSHGNSFISSGSDWHRGNANTNIVNNKYNNYNSNNNNNNYYRSHFSASSSSSSDADEMNLMAMAMTDDTSTATTPAPVMTTTMIVNDNEATAAGAAQTPISKPINTFVYHRVMDAAPRLVGAGLLTGRKQRLPFVAITDRRLETSKRVMLDRQKDFEQNHYPLP